ncbi:hypothetical protein [Desulfolutivibrio sulfoxidireducens]|uniref:hypothetical protein n=1 Tax=Desulfolutivibrio sulfoxidireducens TaxID=2773299 RepID=UPI00159DCE70|nr:hypothetical protein [Desulfolutivibrio sulfoxidireducens]QLA14747.1 hypothetical protein GD605_00575 [Desulfolutivibrio sulfoxidireducens]QLA18329.1 hypothetical protein GD604_00575 [Desulfolutivibrio sulfoxidireducens]
MTKNWLREKHDEFVRDLLRDFCLSARILEERFQAFDRGGGMVFEILRDLLGEQMNKGLLWRLKDTAHHLFRDREEESPVGQFLDWCIGYIFHETMKLKEDAYQQQNYAPWFREMQGRALPETDLIISRELFQLLMQTNESMQRESRRIRFIIRQCRKLFPLYLADQDKNLWLARFLFKRNDLVREVFEESYRDLTRAIYKEAPEMLEIMASRSLREGGWVVQAAEAAEAACRMWPDSQAAVSEKRAVDAWRTRLRV